MDTPQTILRSELVARIARNSKYSLRCFARQLKVSPAYLSQIINGKRTLSLETAASISESLQWPEAKSQRFVSLVRLDRTIDTDDKEALRRKIAKANIQYSDLQQEQIAIMSDWRFAATLELTEVEGFKSCERWIAKRLGITVIEAADIVYRLMRSGLLRVDESGRFCKTNQHCAMTGPNAKKAIQSYHREVLKRAAQAVFDPIENREFRSITVPTDPSRLMEFKQRIRKFEDELMSQMEDGPRTSVFQFSMQLFRIDRPLESKSQKVQSHGVEDASDSFKS